MGTFGIYGWDCVKNRNGGINRKATLDKEFTEGDHGVVFSTMKGAHYYSVCRDRNGVVYGLVCITSIRDGEFWYKPLTEDMGPRCEAMPTKYLDYLDEHAPLDDTNDPHGYARKWRAKCREHNEEKSKERKARNARRKRLRELGYLR